MTRLGLRSASVAWQQRGARRRRFEVRIPLRTIYAVPRAGSTRARVGREAFAATALADGAQPATPSCLRGRDRI